MHADSPRPSSSSFREISYEVRDAIATVTLDRPAARNALSPTMERELLEAFDLSDGDDEVRAVIVTGRGSRFCVGADLSGGSRFDMAARAEEGGLASAASNDGPQSGGGLVALRIFQSLKPVVAAVNGPAVGGGAAITLPMDVRVAAEGAKFGFVFTRIGISPGGTSTWFLPRLVGVTRALDWMLSGRVFPVSEALTAGLVQSVHAPDELYPAALAAARHLIESSAPVSVAVTRRLVWGMLASASPEEAQRIESACMASLGTSADVREGIDAFLGKRAADFPMVVSRDMPTGVDWDQIASP